MGEESKLFDIELARTGISAACDAWKELGMSVAECFYAANTIAVCAGSMLDECSEPTRRLVELLTYTEEDVEASAAIADYAALRGKCQSQ